MVSLVLGLKTMAFCILGNNSTNSATSEASGVIFETISVKANYSGTAPAGTMPTKTFPLST